MAEFSMKRLAANQKRSLTSIKKRLEALAVEWSEVDNGTMWAIQELADKAMWAIQELADKVERVSDEMQEFVK